MGISVLVCVFALFCSFASIRSIKYETGAGILEDKLNVHLVPHSHDDVGWLKTIDQYYIGSNNSIQAASVESILDSVVEALGRDPNRKFIFAEQAFFQRWWTRQTMETQEDVKKLVDVGRLEFVNGGWCMHDEATTHYIDMVDQTTMGHHFIKKHFNNTPRAGWQIDTFGHSAVQAYLLGVELGFDSVHFARIDYQDRERRKEDKSLEVIWRGSQTLGGSSQIFANAFPVHYGPPEGFYFEVDSQFDPIQDDPSLDDYDVDQRVNDFITAAMTQANVTRTNHIMWTMGGDFAYQYAESWFKQMDKFIHYVNKDGRVNALYSTPSLYTDAKNAANETWPLKFHDYFPYADRETTYWTGFYSSRPAFKRYVRALSGYYLAARQLEFLARRRSEYPDTFSLGDALGIAQHHDAITGTAKQHTTNNYIKRLALGASEAEAVVSSSLSCLMEANSGRNWTSPASIFSQCQLLNITYCPPTEQDIPEGKSLIVVAYNPLGWRRTDVIRVPVDDTNLSVKDSSGDVVEAQFVDIDTVTINLREFYTKAYLGISSEKVPKYWLYFGVSVPPLGWDTYFISKALASGGCKSGHASVFESPGNHTVDIGPSNMKMSFSSGQLIRMFNSEAGVDVPVQQSFLWYGSSDSPPVSGAYIFNPGNATVVGSTAVPMKVVRGPLLDEVHQQFDSWIHQVTRLYKDKEYCEVEFTVGPIPIDDYLGSKAIITRITTNMSTNKVFYTDSNGRDFVKRIRDYREDWNLTVNQPVAGNYYPINLGIYTTDTNYEFSVLVDRATGGASINDGEIELMLHRRSLVDDGEGLEEALDEQVCVEHTCEGLTIRGNYYINVNKLGTGARWRRTAGQEIYSPLLLAFTHENLDKWKASHVVKATSMDRNYTLPLNVALITLQELEDRTVLLRLAHLYEAGEDAEHSTMANVDLKNMFAGKRIRSVKEMSLSANQEKSKMRRLLEWKVEGRGVVEPMPKKGGPVNASTLVVELGPMELRTFLLIF